MRREAQPLLLVCTAGPRSAPMALLFLRRTLQGIATDYLPANTVPLRTVEVEGCKEFNFR